MPTVTISAVCDAIHVLFEGATGIGVVHSYNQLTEGIEDTPLAEVYWQSGNTDPIGGQDRIAYGAAARATDLVYHVDVYAATRNDLGENMKTLVDLVDAFWTRLETITTGDILGITGVRAIKWQAERVTFERPAGSAIRFFGFRFVITVRIF
jgi:hypothetical protein